MLGNKMRLVKDVDATMEKTANSLDEYRTSFKQLLKKWYILLIGVLLGWLMTCSNCMIAYFVVRASGMTVNWLEMLCLTIFTYCSVTFIPTPGNTGAAEVGFYAVFAGLQSTFWVTMLWRVMSYYSILLIGLCVIVFTPLKRKIQSARIKSASERLLRSCRLRMKTSAASFPKQSRPSRRTYEKTDFWSIS